MLDVEWMSAENANEELYYYLCDMPNGGKCIKRYKPSVAKLCNKRLSSMGYKQLTFRNLEIKDENII